MYALWAGEIKHTSTATMEKYSLATPRNVSKNKEILEEKDIVESHGELISFNDLIFDYWLRKS